jgi:hypothetical protein
MRSTMRESVLAKLKAEKNKQAVCSHRRSLSGSSEDYKPCSAFCFLKLPTGEIVGCCLYCRKIISSIDPKDKDIFQEAFSSNGRDMAQSGQTLAEDDNQLFGQLARYTPEERTRILKQTISGLKKEIKESKFVGGKAEPRVEYKPEPPEVPTADLYEMDMEDLKALAKKQVNSYKRRVY